MDKSIFSHMLKSCLHVNLKRKAKQRYFLTTKLEYFFICIFSNNDVKCSLLLKKKDVYVRNSKFSFSCFPQASWQGTRGLP